MKLSHTVITTFIFSVLLLVLTTLGSNANATTTKQNDIEIELIEDFAFVYDENYHNLPYVMSTIETLDKDVQIRLIKEIRSYETNKKRRLELDRIIYNLQRKNK